MGNWYLGNLGSITKSSPLYLGLYVNMQGLTQAAGLFDRIRGRLWRAGGAGSSGVVDDFVVADNLALETGNAWWIDIDVSRADIEPATPTSGTGFTVDHTMGKLEVGFDRMLGRNEHGSLVLGIGAHYGEVASDIRSVLGNSSIDTQGYGLGLTGTWYTDTGAYVDAQARYTGFSNRISSATKGELKDDLDGSGKVVSLEVGKRLSLSPDWMLTPQFQLQYSDIEFDQFVDSQGATIAARKGNSTTARAGLLFERRGPGARSGSAYNFYGKLNVYKTFDRDKRIDFSGTTLSYDESEWLGEAGIGSVYSWGQGNSRCMARSPIQPMREARAISSPWAGP